MVILAVLSGLAGRASESNQRQAGVWVNLLFKVLRVLRKNQLACRPHRRFQQVAAVCRTVRAAHHHMRVNLRLAIFRCDISDYREQLNLLIELYSV